MGVFPLKCSLCSEVLELHKLGSVERECYDMGGISGVSDHSSDGLVVDRSIRHPYNQSLIMVDWLFSCASKATFNASAEICGPSSSSSISADADDVSRSKIRIPEMSAEMGTLCLCLTKRPSRPVKTAVGAGSSSAVPEPMQHDESDRYWPTSDTHQGPCDHILLGMLPQEAEGD